MGSFTKVRVAKGQVILSRVDNRTISDSIAQTMTSEDPPRPELRQSLQAFTKWVIEICDLPASWAEKLTVISVSVSRGEQGGIVVTAMKKVSGSNAPVVLHTPHVPEHGKSSTDPALPEEVTAFLAALEREAEKFWNGERAQQDMFSEDQPYAKSHDDVKPKGDKSGKAGKAKALPATPRQIEGGEKPADSAPADTGDQPFDA